MYELVIIIPIIRTDFIEKCLETLYTYTDKELFRVIVIDQTPEGVYEKIKDKVHFYIRPYRNLGFAKAANEGIIHARHWKTPFIGILNDDTEFIHKDWWNGVKEEFAQDPKILCVNPESPRVPLWGYGRPHKEYIDIIEHKDHYSDEDWNYLKQGDYENILSRYQREPEDLLVGEDGKKDWQGRISVPQAFPLTKRGVIDAIAMWFPIFKLEFFDNVGMFSEHYYPGGGEDYDLNTRGYSCAWPDEREDCDENKHYRLVSTMKSWVWHWWGQSKDRSIELSDKLNLYDTSLRWNDYNYHWDPNINKGHHADPWGHYDDNGICRPFKRIKDLLDTTSL